MGSVFWIVEMATSRITKCAQLVDQIVLDATIRLPALVAWRGKSSKMVPAPRLVIPDTITALVFVWHATLGALLVVMKTHASAAWTGES